MAVLSRRSFLVGSTTCSAICQVRKQQDDSASFWDKVYASEKPIFSREPTALVVSAAKDRAPGKALDIGMGQGRNAVFLARQGWDVTGFDPSEEAVRQAQAQAKKLGVRLRTLVAREEEFEMGTLQWDLIVMTYVRRLHHGDADHFWSALKPNGTFVYENNNIGEHNDLLREFLAFRILRFEDVETNADWHPERKQQVERLIAQKYEGR